MGWSHVRDQRPENENVCDFAECEDDRNADEEAGRSERGVDERRWQHGEQADGKERACECESVCASHPRYYPYRRDLRDDDEQRVDENNDPDLGGAEINDSRRDLEEAIALETTTWSQIYEFLKLGLRRVVHERNTSETQIMIDLNVDGSGKANIITGLGFFDHMLEQIARHGKMNLTLRVNGDLHIDEHHTIEDTGIALGEAFARALADKRGMERYGFALPMDEADAKVLIDFGGRNWIVWNAEFRREKIGEVPTEMFFHFFKSFSDAARCNLNIECRGENEHHKIEAIFKAFAKAIRMAVKRDPMSNYLPSTKGVL